MGAASRCQPQPSQSASWNHFLRGIIPIAGTIPTMTADLPIPAHGAESTAIDWGRCLMEHAEWLRQVILARTGEPQAVDEVWQQVALAAVTQRSPLADPAKIAPWLHRLAVVLSARYRRQQGRSRRALAAAAIQSSNCAAAGDPITLL